MKFDNRSRFRISGVGIGVVVAIYAASRVTGRSRSCSGWRAC